MQFSYEYLSPAAFEELIILICQKLFGLGTQPFSEGRDGGRDGKFVGTAEAFPSKASPWTGTTIIQVKHASGYNRHFLENSFFSESSKSCVINQEIPRIRALRNSGELDNYILFSNRRKTAGAEAKIHKYISEKCNIPYESVHICGTNDIDLLLKQFPDIKEKFLASPITFEVTLRPNELSEVIEAFADKKDSINKAVTNEIARDFERTNIADKNKYNNLTNNYSQHLLDTCLKESRLIYDFISDPNNEDIRDKYETAIADIESKIIANKSRFPSFDDLFNHILDVLISSDPILSDHYNTTRAILCYMYWNCDIGRIYDAPSD